MGVDQLTSSGGGGGAVTDSGTDDSNGGDIYVLPQDDDRLSIGGTSSPQMLLRDEQIRFTTSGFPIIQTANTKDLRFGANDTEAWAVQWNNQNLEAIGDGNLDLNNNSLIANPQDVRNISGQAQGWVAYHDGSGTNTEGLAAYNGTNWISQVDGTTIS